MSGVTGPITVYTANSASGGIFDTQFDPDFLANGVAAMRPRCLMQAQCLRLTGEIDEAGVHWDWSRLVGIGVVDPALINCFSTRGLFLHVADFLELGGFHPVLLPHYLSDYEFSMRAHRRGLALVSEPSVQLRFDDDPALTGIRTIQGLSILQGMCKSLSIRSTANPVYWSSFVLLGSPLRYLRLNLFRVWWRFVGPLRDEVRQLLAPFRRAFGPLRRFLGRLKRKIQREWAARIGISQ